MLAAIVTRKERATPTVARKVVGALDRLAVRCRDDAARCERHAAAVRAAVEGHKRRGG